MAIHLNNEHPTSRISRLYFEKRIRRILQSLKKSRAILGVTFVDDLEITRLNRMYMKKKGPTDVLSFPMDSDLLLGDVVISLDTARRQAQELGHSLREECVRLLIHGILHLLGYDHVKDKDWKVMVRKEKALYRLVEKMK